MSIAEYYERPLHPQVWERYPERGKANDEQIGCVRDDDDQLTRRLFWCQGVTGSESTSGTGADIPVNDDSGIRMRVLPHHITTGGVAAGDDQINTLFATRVLHAYDIELDVEEIDLPRKRMAFHIDLADTGV